MIHPSNAEEVLHKPEKEASSDALGNSLRTLLKLLIADVTRERQHSNRQLLVK